MGRRGFPNSAQSIESENRIGKFNFNCVVTLYTLLNMVLVNIGYIHTHRHTQTYTDIHRHTQTYTDIHGHTQTYTDIHGHPRTYTDKHGHTRT